MNQYDAARRGELVRVEELVTAANVNNDYEMAVLHYACAGGQDEVVARLLGCGADVNAIDSAGRTPLLYSASNDHPRCIKLLIAAGADASLKDDFDAVPLHKVRHAECAALLISAYPAGVFSLDCEGATPLHSAVRSGRPEVCRLLLDAPGVVLDAADIHGCTPLSEALSFGGRDIAEILLDRGARLDLVKLGHYLKSRPGWAISFVARRNACRSLCWAVLELARRRSRVIGGNGRDVLGVVARILWESRRDESWERKAE